MPDFTNLSIAQAALDDPTTSATDLQAIAASQPALWPGVVEHPSAYPDLLDWLQSFGDPAIAEAVATRRARESVPPVPEPSAPESGLTDVPEPAEVSPTSEEVEPESPSPEAESSEAAEPSESNEPEPSESPEIEPSESPQSPETETPEASDSSESPESNEPPEPPEASEAESSETSESNESAQAPVAYEVPLILPYPDAPAPGAPVPTIDETVYTNPVVAPQTYSQDNQQPPFAQSVRADNASAQTQPPRQPAWVKTLIIALGVLLVVGGASLGVWALFFKDKGDSTGSGSFGSAAGAGAQVANISKVPSLAWTWSVPDIDSKLKPYAKQSRVTISQDLGVVSSYFDRATWAEKTEASKDAVAGFHPMVYGLNTASGEQLWDFSPVELFGDSFAESGTVTIIASDDLNTVLCASVFVVGDATTIGFATLDARTGEVLASSTDAFPAKSTTTSIRYAAGQVVVSRLLSGGGIRLVAYEPSDWTQTWEKTVKGEKSVTWATSVFGEYVVVRPTTDPALSVTGGTTAFVATAKTTVLSATDGTEQFTDLAPGTGLIVIPDGYLKLDLTSAVAQDKEKNPVASAQVIAVDSDLHETWDAPRQIAVMLWPSANRIDIPGDVADGLIPVSCSFRAPLNEDAPVYACSYDRVDMAKGSQTWDRQPRDVAALWSLSGQAALFPIPGAKQLVWVSWKTGEEVDGLAAADGATFTIAGRSGDYVFISERGRDATTRELFVNQVLAVSKANATVAWRYDMASTQTLTAWGQNLVLVDSADQSISGLR
ncbi:MAG: hypothetical protein LBN10_10830 [Propionibacteriaceae bacterium]|nr:hypothetical protein [Propionibacteriaceae bacterium]